MNASDIKKIIEGWCLHSGSNIFIPEFTFKGYRIDVAIVDTTHRWVRGFEIKVSRNDFLQDTKWVKYAKFCSTLSIVCPEGLIQPEEIKKPFGLVWIFNEGKLDKKLNVRSCSWKKRPENFQKKDLQAWLYTYIKVIEAELPRLQVENNSLRLNQKD